MATDQNKEIEIERIEKLTALQAGMYFHHEIDRNDGSYHEQHVFHVKGAVRLEYVQTALKLLAQTHDVLRTSFVTFKGELRQIVLKERKLESIYEKTDRNLDDLQKEDIDRGFDLRKDSLLRLKIAEIGEPQGAIISGI